MGEMLLQLMRSAGPHLCRNLRQALQRGFLGTISHNFAISMYPQTSSSNSSPEFPDVFFEIFLE